jgi:hypothetical protein
MSWRDQIEIHPAALLFPPLNDDELVALGEDIKANGLRQPVAIFDDKVLDGVNRLDSMERDGIRFDVCRNTLRDLGWEICIHDDDIPDGLNPFGVVVLRGIDPVAYVISANLKRRHLTSEGKRYTITNALKLMPDRSNNYIAKLLGVDDKTVASVRIDLSRSEIPNGETRTDSKGRQQPAHKPKRASKPRKPKPDHDKPDNVQALADARKTDHTADEAPGYRIERAQLDNVSKHADFMPPDDITESEVKLLTPIELAEAVAAFSTLNKAVKANWRAVVDALVSGAPAWEDALEITDLVMFIQEFAKRRNETAHKKD